LDRAKAVFPRGAVFDGGNAGTDVVGDEERFRRTSRWWWLEWRKAAIGTGLVPCHLRLAFGGLGIVGSWRWVWQLVEGGPGAGGSGGTVLAS